MFAKSLECCVNVFNYSDCPTKDVCATTSSPTPAVTWGPSAEPTQGPSTKMPTMAPILLSDHAHDGSPGNDVCRGKNKRECRVRPCMWDWSDKSCVLLPERIGSTPKPSDAPSPAPVEVAMDRCGGKNKRQCAKDPRCGWDASMRSCSDSDEAMKMSPSAVACVERRWHPTTAVDRVCTNAGDYPPLWDAPTHSGEYLLSSAEECCRKFYDGGGCDKVDVCGA